MTLLLLLAPRPAGGEEIIVGEDEEVFSRPFVGIISEPMGVGDMPVGSVKFPAGYFD